MTATDPGVDLLDFDAVLPCEMAGHDVASDGCWPTEPASWVLDLAHPGQAAERKLACGGKVIWLRERMNDTVRCPHCGFVGTVGDFVKIIGPIGGLPE